MTVTRRQFLATVSAGVAAACSQSSATTRPAKEQRLLHAEPRGADKETVLVCMPDTSQTREVWRGLSDEISGEYTLFAVQIDDRNSGSLIAEAVSEYAPSAIVLMNNPTVSSYRQYLASPTTVRKLPAVVVMTSFVDSSQLMKLGATGITYEVPLITVVTNLRRLISSSVERIGVVYRSPLAPFMAKQRELARREQIHVADAVVTVNPNASELKYAIRSLKSRADALWLLNDDRLLSPTLIAKGWLPGLNEKPWRPTIVGAASLVSASQSLGTFAVLPDHTALGVQTANMIFEIADSGWSVSRAEIAELPLSTTTTVDLTQARDRFELRDGALAQVDRVVE